MSQYGGDREFQVGDKVLITGPPSEYTELCNERRGRAAEESFSHFIGSVGTIRIIHHASSQGYNVPPYTLYVVDTDGGPSEAFPVEHIAPHTYQVGDNVLITGSPSSHYYDGTYEAFSQFIGRVGTIRSIHHAGSHTTPYSYLLYTLYEVYPDGGPDSTVFPVGHIKPHT